MSTELSPSARIWLQIVMGRLGMTEAQREECVAGAFVVIREVTIEFLQPAYGDKSFVVARAAVGEVPPPGRCESLYQLALEVQGMLCGPHTPVLGLDWPARTLLVSSSLDMSTLGVEDAAAILCSMQQTALQWREAIARTKPCVQAAPAAQAVNHL